MQFIKLGGSLITEKDKAHTPRMDLLDRISAEIGAFLADHPAEKLVIGHGSGSFGHFAASKYGTRQGVKSSTEWDGFHEVWKEARALNLMVMESLLSHGVRAVSFAPSGSITPSSSTILSWNLEPIRSSLGHQLTPVVYGDVVFDVALGGTILSTEELFLHLAPRMYPNRILLAGIEEGVWADYPTNHDLIHQITPLNFPALKDRISRSASPDVTGGMISKVESMLALIRELPDLKVQIFSGLAEGSIYNALCGRELGTTICTEEQTQ
jgi:isopentenyl phosphate kinase